jgi:hypothetical protein
MDTWNYGISLWRKRKTAQGRIIAIASEEADTLKPFSLSNNLRNRLVLKA